MNITPTLTSARKASALKASAYKTSAGKIAGAFSLLLACMTHTNAATFTVTTLEGDANTGITCPASPTLESCTLRQAINAAEDETTNFGADTIVFANGLTGSVLLNVNDIPNDPTRNVGASAFYISTEITIDGDNLTTDGSEGLGMIVLDGQDQRRIFTVEASGNLTVNGLTLTNGRSQGGPSGAGLGGAVFNFGDFTLTNSTLVDNSAVGGNGVSMHGGFAFGFGSFSPGTNGGGLGTFNNGDFGSGGGSGFGNGGNGGFGGGGGGGGGNNFGNGGNGGNGGFGGGNGNSGESDPFLANGGSSGGGLGAGGAIFQFSGSLTLLNTSFSDNQVIRGFGATNGQALGSALFVLGGAATINHSTFVGNGSDNDANAIFVFEGENDMDLDNINGIDIIDDQSLTISNSLLADTVACAGLAPTDAGGNLASNGCGPIDAPTIPVTPISGLATSLTDNGGPTQTFALLEGSNAVDIATIGVQQDQRGISRPQGAANDSGAFESTFIPTLNLSISSPQINEFNDFSILTVSLSAPSSSATEVTVISSDPSSVLIPTPNIVIPANTISSEILVVAINNNLADGLRTVSFTASAAGFELGTIASLDIIDDELDGDGDGITDAVDNCPADANPDQANFDLDAEGDACDASNDAALTFVFDDNIITEGGSVSAFVRRNSNTDQALTVDLSIEESNTMQIPQTVTIEAGETDSESFSIISIDDVISNGDRVLILMAMATDHSSTTNLILVQDDDDDDSDSVANLFDNCPLIANSDQANFDDDSQGNACDSDDDNDGLPDAFETANGLNPLDASDANADPDGDNFTNLEEFSFRTDPQVFDNDDNNNGVPDSVDRIRASLTPIMQMLLMEE